MKERGKNPQAQTNEEKISSLHEKGFRVVISKTIQNLGNKMEAQINRLEAWIKKIQEVFNKELEEFKEKAVAPDSSTLAWKVPWTEEPGRLQSMGSLRVSTTEQLHFHFSLSCIGEGNGNPLQCSCLENPRDREAWWAAVYGVIQIRTRLKRLSSSSSRIARVLR